MDYASEEQCALSGQSATPATLQEGVRWTPTVGSYQAGRSADPRAGGGQPDNCRAIERIGVRSASGWGVRGRVSRRVPSIMFARRGRARVPVWMVRWSLRGTRSIARRTKSGEDTLETPAIMGTTV